MGCADTIVAVSTPAGYALRAVVRLSGEASLDVVGRLFRPEVTTSEHPQTSLGVAPSLRGDWARTFRATQGTLLLPESALGAPATVYVMRAPYSYTREDVVEIHVPGSPALLDMVLDEVLQAGAGHVRVARPGEFTERAFINGRIDLAQAEAVLAVVRAGSEAELLAASARLEGKASSECETIQGELADLRALVEASLDFREQDIELITEQEFLRRAESIRGGLESAIEKGRGELASDGAIHVVICGPPNVGKSSLLNRLAEKDVALVHHRPGTTRDPIQSEVEVGGIYFRLTDTAGIRPKASGVEAVAVEKARSIARLAQLLMLVLDGSAPLKDEFLVIARGADRGRVLCVINKCDLPQVLKEELIEQAGVAGEIFHVSALTGQGLDGLREALSRVVFEGRLDASAADCLFNARQRDALRRAAGRLTEAQAAVSEGLGYEFAALHLREATDDLGEVTGTVTSDDILGRIFSRFCIGK